MTIDSHSRLFRFAYFFKDRIDRPDYVSLCAFFWRAFVFMPLAWIIMIGGGGGFLLMILRLSWLNPNGAAVVVIGLITFVVFCDANMTIKRGLERAAYGVALSVVPTVFWQGLRALKGKVCPIIEVK